MPLGWNQVANAAIRFFNVALTPWDQMDMAVSPEQKPAGRRALLTGNQTP
jgi:hypothetical protein